ARLRPALRLAGQSDRLPGETHPDTEGRVARHAQDARAGQGQEGALPPHLDLRGLRRSADYSVESGLMGVCESGRLARRIGRGAVCGKERRLLGWAPGVALEEGLRRTIDYFR